MSIIIDKRFKSCYIMGVIKITTSKEEIKMNTQDKQIRYSRQREMIYEYLCSTVEHPTAETIYRDLIKRLPNLSLGTVYRNLKFLQEQGKITALTSTDGIEHFDAICENHAHLICKECGKIVDIENVDYESLVHSLNLDKNFKLEKIELSIIGKCQKCI